MSNLFRVWYKYRHYNATFQTRMKMEHLTNKLFRWLQTGLTSKLLYTARKKGETAAAQCALGYTYSTEPICTSTCPQTSFAPPPQKTHLKAAEWKERLQTDLWNFGICKDLALFPGPTQLSITCSTDGWTSPSALFPPWFECQNPWWDLFMFIRLSSK